MTEAQTPDTGQPPELPLLTPVEARILACLMEKQRATPDAYPLTLNALVTACNQKTSRKPVMHLDPGEVGHTLNQLRDRNLVHASLGSRSERYDHKMRSNYRIDVKQQAVLSVLMLRGPETAGELRTHAGRLAEFATLNEIEATLLALEERGPPLVVRLPRLAGKREERHAHLLCGEVEQEPPAAAPVGKEARPDRLAALEGEVARLRAELDVLWQATGLADQRPDPAEGD